MKRVIVKVDQNGQIIPRCKKIEVKETDDIATLLSQLLFRAKPSEWFKIIDL